MSQYPIPNQRRTRQGGAPLLLHPSPKITLQLCTISLLPSWRCSVTPHHSVADSPQDACWLRGGLRQLQEEAPVRQSGGGARRVLGRTSQGVLLFSYLTFLPLTRFAQQLVTLLGCVHREIPRHESLLAILLSKMQQPQLLSICTNIAPKILIFIVRQKKTHLI